MSVAAVVTVPTCCYVTTVMLVGIYTACQAHWPGSPTATGLVPRVILKTVRLLTTTALMSTMSVHVKHVATTLVRSRMKCYCAMVQVVAVPGIFSVFKFHELWFQKDNGSALNVAKINE